MLHHYLSRYAPPDHWRNLYGYRHTYSQWFDLGALGVQLFFIISGFVIFMTLEKCGHLVEFWVRRLARLYPAYIAATLITFVLVNSVGPAELHSHPQDVLIGLLFLTPYVPGSQFVDGSYWSLVTEMQFYFLVGLIYVTARARFAVVWTAFVCVGACLWVAGPLLGAHLLFSIARYVFLIESMPYFTAGILFYHLYKGDRKPVALLGLVTVLSYAAVAPQLQTLQPLVTGLMVLAFSLFVAGRFEWIATRPLVFLGSISYSFYLLHQYIGVTLIRYLTGYLPDLAAMACALCMCIVLAYVLYVLIEVPGKIMVLRWARARLFPRLSEWMPAFNIRTTAPVRSRPSALPGNVGQQT